MYNVIQVFITKITELKNLLNDKVTLENKGLEKLDSTLTSLALPTTNINDSLSDDDPTREPEIIFNF